MHWVTSRALSTALALASTIALVACGDDVKPTEVRRNPDIESLTSNAAKRAATISVGTLTLTSTSFTINGARATLTTTIDNSGPSLANVSATCTITQKKASRAACATIVNFGGASGTLPTGTSTISTSVVAANDQPGQGTLTPGVATIELTVRAGTSQVATQSVEVNLLPVAMFTNILYTDFNPGDPEFDGSNMLASVRSFGYPVSQFTGLDDAAWAQATQSNVVIIPELTHDLFAKLSPAAHQSLVDFVNRGGTLIVVAQSVGFLNRLFGLSLKIEPVFETSISLDARGTSFEGGPATLALNSFNQGLTPSSIPFRALDIYIGPVPPNTTTGSNFASHVTVIRPSTLTFNPKGQIIVLGWNWLLAKPTGPLDGGWNEALNRAIRFESNPF